MPKYNVTLIRHMSYTSDFSIDAENQEQAINKINNMNTDFLEDELGWIVVDYARPTIDNIEDVNDSSVMYTELKNSRS